MTRKPRPDPGLRGYARHTARRPGPVQLKALELAGCGEIYLEGRDGETLDAAIRSLRPGDKLMVTELRVIASGSRQITEALDRIAAAGAVLIEVETGRRSDSVDGLRGMMSDALRREGHATEIAKAAGAKGGKVRKRAAEERAERARRDWMGDKLTNEEIVAKHKVSTGTLYAVLGRRPKAPGPKPKKSAD